MQKIDVHKGCVYALERVVAPIEKLRNRVQLQRSDKRSFLGCASGPFQTIAKCWMTVSMQFQPKEGAEKLEIVWPLIKKKENSVTFLL